MKGYECMNDCLTPAERGKILSHFHSLLFWVGEFVPELEELEGKEVPLRDVVFQFITEQSPSEATIKGAHELAALLDRKAKALEEDLATKNMGKLRAYEVMHEALGLLRAVDELRDVKAEERHVKAKALMAKVSDERRWLDFVKKINTN
ncbi:MAG: DUF5788 family protein [Methanomassiliicoccales archaeon]|nr:DUF5788 family protein [Methanomassiliicoccales archaeon]TFG56973.1 MAG: hypothetical protein E4H30_02055 [Methanomassiliicoccus sp.]